MGLLPDLLPGYTPVSTPGAFGEYTARNGSADLSEPGLDLLQIFDAAGEGKLSALYVVGANPVGRFSIDPASLRDTFVVVQDMFLTETAALADVILPAANLYEKAGSVTNSYGDLQQVAKAGDRAGVRTDFEMIVRIADRMGANIRALIPFGKGLRADMGQTRGAQSGEADRHAVWLTANNLEPRLSPFDPFAILDEIQRLVPGYADRCSACNCSAATTSTCRPPRPPTSSRYPPRAAISSCPPTTHSLPPAPSAATPPCSATCKPSKLAAPSSSTRPPPTEPRYILFWAAPPRR